MWTLEDREKYLKDWTPGDVFSTETGLYQRRGRAPEPADVPGLARLSDKTILKEFEPPMVSPLPFLSELAAVVYKEKLWKTVGLMTGMPQSDRDWWVDYLSGLCEYVADVQPPLPPFALPRCGRHNIDNTGQNEDTTHTARARLPNMMPIHEAVEAMSPCLLYAGHTKSEREKNEKEALEAVRYRNAAHRRRRMPPCDLAQDQFVFIKVAPDGVTQGGSFLFDVGRVVGGWVARGHEGDPWTAMVNVTWFYRSRARYDGPTFGTRLERSGERLAPACVPRNTIVVDHLMMGRKPNSATGQGYYFTSAALQAIRGADVGFLPRARYDNVAANLGVLHLGDVREGGQEDTELDGGAENCSGDTEAAEGRLVHRLATQDGNESRVDVVERRNALLALWSARLRRWPLPEAEQNAACAVWEAMGVPVDAADAVGEVEWRGTALRELRKAHAGWVYSYSHQLCLQMLGDTDGGRLQECAIEAFVHQLCQRVSVKEPSATMAATTAHSTTMVSALPVVFISPDDERTGGVLELGYHVWPSLSRHVPDALLRSAGPYLPWGASVWNIGAIVGVFRTDRASIPVGDGAEEEEEDDGGAIDDADSSSYVLVRLQFTEWKRGLGDGDEAMRLVSGTVHVSAVAGDDRVVAVERYFSRQAGLLFGGTWQVKKHTQLIGGADTESSCAARKEQSGLLALLGLRAACVKAPKTGDGVGYGDVEAWYNSLSKGGDIGARVERVANARRGGSRTKGVGGVVAKKSASAAAGKKTGGAGTKAAEKKKEAAAVRRLEQKAKVAAEKAEKKRVAAAEKAEKKRMAAAERADKKAERADKKKKEEAEKAARKKKKEAEKADKKKKKAEEEEEEEETEEEEVEEEEEEETEEEEEAEEEEEEEVEPRGAEMKRTRAEKRKDGEEKKKVVKRPRRGGG
jgi:hypothetical protein